MGEQQMSQEVELPLQRCHSMPWMADAPDWHCRAEVVEVQVAPRPRPYPKARLRRTQGSPGFQC